MGLREDTIERIKVEGNFAMAYYAPKDVCGTACCIAGNIVLAAGLPIDFDSPYLFSRIPRAARHEWAKWYGQEEADRLQFNSAWGKLEDVTVEEAIAHLNGAAAVMHGDWGSID